MASETNKKDKSKKISSELIFLPAVIIFLSIVSGIINPNFFELNNFLAIFQQIAVLGIVASAMLMLLISGMLDLSYGSLIGLCGVLLCVLFKSGVNSWLALLIMFVVAIAGGTLNGLIVTKSKSEPLIITIGTGYIFKGIGLVMSKGTYQSMQGNFPFIGTGKVLGIPMPMIVLIIVMVIVFLVLKYTKYGRRLHVIGGNQEVAFLSGLNVDKYKILNFAIGGLIVGLATFVLVSRVGSALSTSGDGYEFRALAACIIGGASFSGAKGTVLGTFFGVVLLGLISNALNILSVDTFYQTVVLGVIIVIAVVVSNINKKNNK